MEFAKRFVSEFSVLSAMTSSATAALEETFRACVRLPPSPAAVQLRRATREFNSSGHSWRVHGTLVIHSKTLIRSVQILARVKNRMKLTGNKAFGGLKLVAEIGTDLRTPRCRSQLSRIDLCMFLLSCEARTCDFRLV